MLQYLRQEANRTLTENGAETLRTTGSDCLDLFAAVGALRRQPEDDIMYVLIGGDIRPRVVDALNCLVGKIKSECVVEKEIF